MDAVKQEHQQQKPISAHLDGAPDFQLPKVDMARAASIKPSRCSGKNVMLLVTVVSGLGVSPADDGR